MSMVDILANCFEKLASASEQTGLKIGGISFNYLKDNIKTTQKNGVDIVVINLQPINVSLVAPSGAGKTTLLSTVMKDITEILPKGFAVYTQSPDDA
jgi:ATP-dependent protease Clp ATPase subunit